MEIYLPDSESKNLRHVAGKMLGGLRPGSYIGYRLFLNTVRTDYSKTKFGPLWDFLEPLAYALVFFVLFHFRVIEIGRLTIPYGVYVCVGVLLWQTFLDSINSPLDIFHRYKSLLSYSKAPPEAFIGALLFKIYFNASFRIGVILLIAIITGLFSLSAFLKFLLLFSIIILIGFSVGLLLAPFNSIYGDVGRFVGMMLRPCMFLSSVVIPIPESGALSVLNVVNPVAISLNNLRGILIEGRLVDGEAFMWVVFLHAGLFLMAWLIFHLSIRVVVERY